VGMLGHLPAATTPNARRNFEWGLLDTILWVQHIVGIGRYISQTDLY